MKKLGFALSIALISACSSLAQDPVNSISGVFATDDPAGADFASNYFTTGNGSGFAHIRNGSLVTITITNTFSSAGAITASGDFGGNLVINSLDDVKETGDANADIAKVKSSGFNKRVVQIKGGSSVTFNEGEYVGNNSRNPAIWATTEIRSTAVNINGASFRGGDSERDRGGAGIYLRLVSSVTINNEVDEGNNLIGEDYIQGGDGGKWTAAGDVYFSDKLWGGDGLQFFENANNTQNTGSLVATNLNVRGGTGGISKLTARFQAVAAWGGDGVHNANGPVMLNGGWAYGGKGGDVTINGDSDIFTLAYTPDGNFAVGTASIYAAGGRGLDLRKPGAGSYITDMFEVRGGDGGTAIRNGDSSDVEILASGGNGATVIASIELPFTGNFYGGNGGIATANGAGGNAQAFGGTAVSSAGGTALKTAGTFAGGNGGTAFARGGTANADGGDGFSSFSVSRPAGVILAEGGTYQGGAGGTAQAGGTGSTASASGGDGARTRLASIINGGTFIGGAGGRANSATADADGGMGVFVFSDTLTIKDGVFQGGVGGTALSSTTSSADGGNGVYVESGTLTIQGGTFSGGRAGNATGTNATAQAGRGVFSMGGDVTINDVTGTNTLVNNGIYFANAGKDLRINGGTINGEILFDGTGTSDFILSTNASIEGIVKQQGGTVEVELSQAEASKLFKEVSINGTMSFDKAFESANNGRFNLAGTSTLEFLNSLTLSSGSSIGIGNGTVTTGGDMDMGAGSSLTMSFNGLTGLQGRVDLGGNSFAMSNSTARIFFNGAAAAPMGSVQVLTAGSTFLATNISTMVQAELGWLVNETAVTNGGIRIDFDYNSLANSSLGTLGANIITALDMGIQGAASNVFYNLNNRGEAAGTAMIRHTVSQLPDVADASFQTQQQVAEQIAARGTEFRAMNGFASSKHAFGNKLGPTGAAGPPPEEKNVQGWIRAYGAWAEKNSDGTFPEYESGTYGTVIGIDKSFGNLLIGLAGGIASTDLDAADAYRADVSTYHGSIYSTIGGDSAFLDLAFTYGHSNTEERNDTMDGDFDSVTYSGYIGAGKKFNVSRKIAVTPEASILASYYDQAAYQRNFLNTPTLKVNTYDAYSYLGSLGINIASSHQIDWFNLGWAMIPELRVHWLHEFNSELDDFSYIIGGSSETFGVRAREEDLLKLGFGLDVWSWRNAGSKFEIDYDGLFSSDYTEHGISGKFTFKF